MNRMFIANFKIEKDSKVPRFIIINSTLDLGEGDSWVEGFCLNHGRSGFNDKSVPIEFHMEFSRFKEKFLENVKRPYILHSCHENTFQAIDTIKQILYRENNQRKIAVLKRKRQHDRALHNLQK